MSHIGVVFSSLAVNVVALDCKK